MSHKKVISDRLTGLSQVIVTRTSSIGLQSGICSKLELKTFIILNTCNGIQHTTYDDINIKINLISFFKRVFAHPDHSVHFPPTLVQKFPFQSIIRPGILFSHILTIVRYIVPYTLKTYFIEFTQLMDNCHWRVNTNGKRILTLTDFASSR